MTSAAITTKPKAGEGGRCNVRTRKGGSCTLPAGWGTPHVGRGACKLHGGAAPSSIAKYEREAALEAMVVFGGAIEVDPLEALLQCVYRAAGVAAWLRLKVESLDGELDPDSAWVRLQGEWTDKQARYAKMAIDAGVSERKVRIMERTGQRIAAALDDAVAPLDLPPEARAAVVERFVTRLQVLEQSEDGDAS